MVECECHQLHLSQMLTNVLIDTWWNVNYYYFYNHLKGDQVLIDTWWNVNYGIGRDVVVYQLF